MNSISVTNARKDIYKLLDKVNDEHVEIVITGKRNNAVLIGEEDWRIIQETLYLHETQMVQKVVDGKKISLSDCEVYEWKDTKLS